MTKQLKERIGRWRCLALSIDVKEDGICQDGEKIKTTVSVKENTESAKINISCDKVEKIYLEGLTSLRGIGEKDFLSCSEGDCIELYNNNDDNEKRNYIPGSYALEIYYENNKVENYTLRVAPKFFSDTNYEKMVDDLEKHIVGITQTKERGDHHVSEDQKVDTPNRMIDYLKEYEEEFKKALFQIKSNPTFEVADDSSSGPIRYKNSYRNFSAIKKRHELNYNLVKNQNLVYCLVQIKKYLLRLKDDFGEYFPKLFDEKEYKSYISMINYVLNSTWVKNVKPRKRYIYKTITLNKSYKTVDRLYKLLRRNRHVFMDAESNFSYYLRCSYELYEYWGFFTVIHTLENLHYKFESDSFEDIEFSKLLWDGLPKPTKVTMSKDDIYIDVIYNEDLKDALQDFVLDKHSINHRIPDIRLDFYDKDRVFIGCTIIDTKYRRLEDLYSDENVVDQMMYYGNCIRNSKIYSNDKYNSGLKAKIDDFKISSINRVGIMEPDKIKEHLKKGLKDWNLVPNSKFIYSLPGDESQNGLKLFLKEAIKDIKAKQSYMMVKEKG